MNVNSNLNKAERIAYIDEKLQSCLLYTSDAADE